MALFTPLNYHRYAPYASPSLRERSATRQSRLLNHILDCLAPLAMTIRGVILLCFSLPAFAATSIPFTINLSEAVNVTGTPRIAVDVGGVTRYATYTSGSGTSALTFTYTMVAGDVDLDGVTVSSPIDLNGGTIKDAVENDATLTFTPPNTSNVKVNYPSLGMDFVYDADGKYALNGTAYNDLSSFLTASGGTFSRTSIGSYFDSTGTLQTAASGAPRFDYDPVTLQPKGILIEEERTNIFFPSSNYSTWINSSINRIDNAIASPDGTSNGTKIIAKNQLAEHRIIFNYSAYSALSTYTFSFYAKKGEYNYVAIRINVSGNWTYDVFDLQNGALGVSETGVAISRGISNVGNGWYRCWGTYSNIGHREFQIHPKELNNVNSLWSGDNISGVYVWGAQLEQGAFPTSYIPTTTAAMTRAADVLTMPTDGWLDSVKGTMFTQASMPFMGAARWPALAALDDGTSNNMIHLYVSDNTGDAKSSQIISGGSALFYSTAGAAYTAGDILKSSIGYAVNDARLAADGVLGIADNSLTIPAVTTLRIGSNAGGNSINFTDGNMQKFKYYPARVSDAQLQLLTQ